MTLCVSLILFFLIRTPVFGKHIRVEASISHSTPVTLEEMRQAISKRFVSSVPADDSEIFSCSKQFIEKEENEMILIIEQFFQNIGRLVNKNVLADLTKEMLTAIEEDITQPTSNKVDMEWTEPKVGMVPYMNEDFIPNLVNFGLRGIQTANNYYHTNNDNVDMNILMGGLVGSGENEFIKSPSLVSGSAKESDKLPNLAGGAEFDQLPGLIGSGAYDFDKLPSLVGGSIQELNKISGLVGGDTKEFGKIPSLAGGVEFDKLPGLLRSDTKEFDEIHGLVGGSKKEFDKISGLLRGVKNKFDKGKVKGSSHGNGLLNSMKKKMLMPIELENTFGDIAADDVNEIHSTEDMVSELGDYEKKLEEEVNIEVEKLLPTQHLYTTQDYLDEIMKSIGSGMSAIDPISEELEEGESESEISQCQNREGCSLPPIDLQELLQGDDDGEPFNPNISQKHSCQKNDDAIYNLLARYNPFLLTKRYFTH